MCGSVTGYMVSVRVYGPVRVCEPIGYNMALSGSIGLVRG